MEQQALVNIEDTAMSIESMVSQTTMIQELMTKLMRPEEHYGVIPGTKKPTLLKPGAEKLCWRFRFDPEYEIIREARDDQFIAYTVACTLYHIPTRARVASGIGSCNSRETKYRYRWDDELTETPIPEEYWKAKNAGDNKEMQRILGKGFRARKNEETGQWVKAKSEKVENDNPWDLDNTLVKMACKRALVAAVLNATAASDIFTQDLEDLRENGIAPKKDIPKEENKIRDGEAKRGELKQLKDALISAGYTTETLRKEKIIEITGKMVKDLTTEDCKEVIKVLMAEETERVSREHKERETEQQEEEVYF